VRIPSSRPHDAIAGGAGQSALFGRVVLWNRGDQHHSHSLHDLRQDGGWKLLMAPRQGQLKTPSGRKMQIGSLAS
jgi:hypothetical protein